MGFLDWIGFVKKEKKLVRYELDPNSVKDHHIIRGQANQIAELQAELAKSKSHQFKQRQLSEQKQEEEKIKTYLQDDKKRLDNQNTQIFFSLKGFFHRYLKDEKFRKNLKITTWDRSSSLGNFGDLGFVGNEFVILNNKNQKVLGTRELKDLFQSIGALKNDISAFRIPINLDKDGIYVENLMLWDAPEIIREKEGFRYSKARKKEFYQLLKEKNAKIQQGYADLQEAETTITMLQDKLDDLEISYNANEKSGEIARAERTKTAEAVSNIEKIWKDTETELTKMRQIEIVQADEIKELTTAVEKLRSKAESEGIALKFDDVVSRLDKVKDLFKQKTLVLPQNSQNKQNS